jgi:peptidoglycan/LPS O-acetylase OafA/YrhL
MYLEGLRGLAALMVFYIHLLPSYWNDLLNMFWEPQNPWLAIFYILSGRVLAISFLKKNNVEGMAISILKRPFRLGIPLVAVTVINVIAKGIVEEKGFTLLQTFMVPIHLLLSNGPAIEPLTEVAWTFSHQFYGSMFIYLLTILLISITEPKGRLLVLMIAFCYTSFTHSWMNHFAVGLFFAVLDNQTRLNSVNSLDHGRELKAGLVIITFLLFCDTRVSVGRITLNTIASLQYNGNGDFGAYTVFWAENMVVLVQASVAMYIIETTALLQSILSHRFFVYLGRISFMLSLTHSILVRCWFEPLQETLVLDTLPRKAFFTVCATVISLVVAEIMTIWIDEPSVWVSSWLFRNVFNSSWTFIDLYKSFPLWPMGVLDFFIDRTQATVDSFSCIFQESEYDRRAAKATKMIIGEKSVFTGLLPLSIHDKES